jgi:glycosyltransferase involved in cell wall biosynthesis
MAGSRVAVITPYYKEPLTMLQGCHASVRRQGEHVDHFLIADGHPQAAIDHWQAKHVVLPSSHDDNGNTPRGVGSLLARSEDYDYIAYLDADNWFLDGHIQSLQDHIGETKAHVATSFRHFYDLSDQVLDVSERAEERLKHVDTSCYLVSRAAFPVTHVWGSMPKILSTLCDRVFFAALKHHRYVVSSTRKKTVAFRTRYVFHYQKAGRPLPDNPKTTAEFKPGLTYLKSSRGIEESVNQLGFWPLGYF